MQEPININHNYPSDQYGLFTTNLYITGGLDIGKDNGYYYQEIAFGKIVL